MSATSTLSSKEVLHQATGYLVKHVGVFFSAEEPVFLPLAQPLWQATITFQMHDVGPFILGVLDIDAQSGEITPLTDDEIDNLLARADAYVAHHIPEPETRQRIEQLAFDTAWLRYDHIYGLSQPQND